MRHLSVTGPVKRLCGAAVAEEHHDVFFMKWLVSVWNEKAAALVADRHGGDGVETFAASLVTRQLSTDSRRDYMKSF